jgi:hypothetical protein
VAYPIGVLQDAFRYSQPIGGRLIREFVARNPDLYGDVIVRRKEAQGIYAELKSLLLQEAALFLDKALYQFCIYKRLVECRHFGWAEVTAYYASFFALCALTRLQGEAITRVPLNDREVGVKVSHVDLIEGSFRMRHLGRPMHESLWRNFVDTYSDFTYRIEEYRPAFPIGDPTAELRDRNAVNYGPDGYEDIYMRSRRLGVLVRQREPDAFMNPDLALGDPFLQKEVLAGLRIRLACEITRFIQEKSEHSDQFKGLTARRVNFLECHCTRAKVRKRLEAWVRGN